MKVTQTIQVVGQDVILVMTAGGRVLGRRVWQGAASYIRQDSKPQSLTLTIPRSGILDIKP